MTTRTASAAARTGRPLCRRPAAVAGRAIRRPWRRPGSGRGRRGGTASAATPVSVDGAAQRRHPTASQRPTGPVERLGVPDTCAVADALQVGLLRVVPGQERLALDAELRTRLVPGAALLADVLVHSPSHDVRGGDPTRVDHPPTDS